MLYFLHSLLFMRSVRYWNAYTGPQKLIEIDVVQLIVRKLLTGDYAPCDLEKLQGTKRPVYSMRGSDEKRVIFTTQDKILHLLDYTATHGYLKTSQYLKRKAATEQLSELQFVPLAEDERPDIETITAGENLHITYEPRDCFNQQFITLDAGQDNAVCATLPLIVNGAAGTGKSYVALSMLRHKIAELQQHHSEFMVLYVTKEKALADELEKNWQYLARDDERAFAQFKSASEVFSISTTLSALASVVQWNTQRKEHTGTTDFTDWSDEALYQEFRICSGLSQAQYIALGRKQCAVADTERACFYATYQKYKEATQLTPVSEFHAQLPDLPKKPLFIVLDEAHNLSTHEINLFRQLAVNEQVAMCIDAHQALLDTYPIRPLIEKLFLDPVTQKTRAETVSLETTYRCPKNIANLVTEVIRMKHWVTGGKHDKKEANTMIAAEGLPEGSTFIRSPNSIPSELTGELGTNVVIITRESLIEEAKEKFNNTLRVLTIAEAQGREYDITIIYKLLDTATLKQNGLYKALNSMPKDHTSPNRAKEADDTHTKWFNDLYVAYSRAIKELHIFENNNKQTLAFLQHITPKTCTSSTRATILMENTEEDWKKEAARLHAQGARDKAQEIEKQKLEQKTSVPSPKPSTLETKAATGRKKNRRPLENLSNTLNTISATSIEDQIDTLDKAIDTDNLEYFKALLQVPGTTPNGTSICRISKKNVQVSLIMRIIAVLPEEKHEGYINALSAHPKFYPFQHSRMPTAIKHRKLHLQDEFDINNTEDSAFILLSPIHFACFKGYTLTLKTLFKHIDLTKYPTHLAAMIWYSPLHFVRTMPRSIADYDQRSVDITTLILTNTASAAALYDALDYNEHPLVFLMPNYSVFLRVLHNTNTMSALIRTLARNPGTARYGRALTPEAELSIFINTATIHAHKFSQYLLNPKALNLPRIFYLNLLQGLLLPESKHPLRRIVFGRENTSNDGDTAQKELMLAQIKDLKENPELYSDMPPAPDSKLILYYRAAWQIALASKDSLRAQRILTLAKDSILVSVDINLEDYRAFYGLMYDGLYTFSKFEFHEALLIKLIEHPSFNPNKMQQDEHYIHNSTDSAPVLVPQICFLIEKGAQTAIQALLEHPNFEHQQLLISSGDPLKAPLVRAISARQPQCLELMLNHLTALDISIPLELMHRLFYTASLQLLIKQVSPLGVIQVLLKYCTIENFDFTWVCSLDTDQKGVIKSLCEEKRLINLFMLQALRKPEQIKTLLLDAKHVFIKLNLLKAHELVFKCITTPEPDLAPPETVDFFELIEDPQHPLTIILGKNTGHRQFDQKPDYRQKLSEFYEAHETKCALERLDTFFDEGCSM